MVMRKIQMVMMSVLLSGIGLSGFAQERNARNEEAAQEMRERQQDLNREMTIEREYDPIVQDATKVSTLPAIRELTITKRPIAYSEYTTPLIPEKEMNVLPPGRVMTDVLHTKRNGYLHFGGGMQMNLMGDFGYHLLNTDRDRLGVYFSHRSTNGNVTFENDWIPKRKAKFNDNLGGLDFKHDFDRATLTLGGNFGYSTFNYYGLPTNQIFSVSSLPFTYLDYLRDLSRHDSLSNDAVTNQVNRIINVYGGISSTHSTSLGYHLDVDYTNFNQKYSLQKDINGMTENHIGVGLGLCSPVDDGRAFGVDVKANILNYIAPPSSRYSLLPSNSSYIDSVFNTHFNATLNPYYRIESSTWKLLLGVNLMYVSQSGENKVFASPNIALDVPFALWSVFYAKMGGGVESNSMAELSRVNRYVNPVFMPDASKTWADLKIGVRSNAATGLWFDIFGGYKYTESDVLFNPSYYPWIAYGFNNVSMVYQPTTQRIQVGATLKYDYKRMVDFYLKGVYDYYTLKHTDTWKNRLTGVGLDENIELKAYGKPAFTANAGINVRPVKPLALNLDYAMLSGMYAYHPIYDETVDGNIQMKTIHDLRFRASWTFNDMFSIYAQFNNLLFQKQAMYYGYPLQPFAAMAGFNINF